MIVGRMRPYICVALLLAAALLCSQPAPREQVGPLPGGGFLLNSGWGPEPAGKQIPPDARLIYPADLYHDSLVVINPQSGMLIDRVKTGRRPYRILFHPDGKSFFVTSWTDGSVGHYDTASGNQLTTVRLGPHPTDMIWAAGKSEASEGETPWAARLFIAASNTNSVYTLGVSEGNELRLVETINTAMTPRQPAGMTPSALAIGQQGKHLYVVCSDANVVAVVDISEERSHVEGFIPTGWYPTAARVLPN